MRGEWTNEWTDGPNERTNEWTDGPNGRLYEADTDKVLDAIYKLTLQVAANQRQLVANTSQLEKLAQMRREDDAAK